MNRRTFLRAGAVCIGLPLLDAMLPRGLGAPDKSKTPPNRMVLLGRPLGLHTPFLFPTKAGKDYEPTRYLKPLTDHKQDFTVFSGMSHKGYPGGHHTSVALLTGVAPEGVRPGDIRNTISLDQEVAERIKSDTRYGYLSLGGGDLSWNRKGIKLPSEERATRVFKQLFIDGTPEETAREIERIKLGHSILDGTREQARTLAKSLSPSDRARLDLLLSSIREAEERLQKEQLWVKKAKPKVQTKPYTEDYVSDLGLLSRERQWFDLVHLALQTDSTRVVALYLWGHGPVSVEGTTIPHHDSTHHGQDEDKIKQLARIEEAEMALFAEFLGKLKSTKEGDRTLLDNTIVFYGSNMGNASAHTCDNLPIFLAGGGFKHAGHVAYDRKDNKQMSNLFVRMMQQMGLEVDRFGNSSGGLSEV